MKRTPVPRAIAYDRLYAMADNLLKRSNPCGKCGKCEYFGGVKSGCCIGCPFLSSTGCTIQSLGCKLWLCHDAHISNSSLHSRQLLRLTKIADKYGFRFARATKEEALSAKKNVSVYGVWYFYYKLHRYPHGEPT